MQIKILESYKLKAVILLGIVVLLVGCTTDNISTVTVPVAAEVPVTRTSSTATVKPTEISTRQPPTYTPTPPPTSTPEPTRTPFPTRTPTPSPWLVEDFSPFLFYIWGDDLYLVRPNGEKHSITEGWLLGGQPWSPDGSKFIFQQGLDSYPFTASIANLKTGEIQQLISNIYGDVYWSPNGRYLFYTTENASAVRELVLYDFDQQQSEVIFEIPMASNDRVLTADWSPDSRQIAFISNLNGQYDLYTLDIETGIHRQLTFSPEAEVLATWSPVDNQLVVVTSAEERIDSQPFYAEKLQLLDDTGAELAYLGPYEYLSTASWSPDGQRIAYSADEGLCILNISDMSSSCPLEDTVFHLNYAVAQGPPASWSADGRWLAFQAIEVPGLGCYQLFLLDLETETVIDPEGPCSVRSQIHWFPIVVQN